MRPSGGAPGRAEMERLIRAQPAELLVERRRGGGGVPGIADEAGGSGSPGRRGVDYGEGQPVMPGDGRRWPGTGRGQTRF
jgi:hypothetical protein